MGSPMAPWPIFSPRTLFFCLVKTSLTNVVVVSSLSVVVAVSNTMRPTVNVAYDRRNGELSDFVPVYSPGLSRKKKAIMIMSVTSCRSRSLEAAATHDSRRRTCTGIDFTQEVGRS